MSRAGKYPVEIKNGVSIENTGKELVVKGPKGELKLSLTTKNAGLVDIKISDTAVSVIPKNENDKDSRAMWGTMARNIANAISGVTEGFSKEIYMKGVGYKASVKGDVLVLIVGYSHDVNLNIPAGLTVEMGAAPTEFTVKCLVGKFADQICKVRKADPYKGKGVFYKGQKVRRKEGKKK